MRICVFSTGKKENPGQEPADISALKPAHSFKAIVPLFDSPDCDVFPDWK
jgi:hypothetical protein